MVPSELDIEARLDVSLEDAVRGAEKSFTVTAASLCQNCHGTGHKNGVFCQVCGGVGEVRRERQVKTKLPPGLLEAEPQVSLARPRQRRPARRRRSLLADSSGARSRGFW